MESNTTKASCTNCYFRHAGLCALRLEEPCPTFRDHAHDPLVRRETVQVARHDLGDLSRLRTLARSAAA